MLGFWCIHYLKSFSSKHKFDEHFVNIRTTKTAGSGGKLLANPCYNKKPMQFGKSLNEAKLLGKQTNSLNAFLSPNNNSKASDGLPTKQKSLVSTDSDRDIPALPEAENSFSDQQLQPPLRVPLNQNVPSSPGPPTGYFW